MLLFRLESVQFSRVVNDQTAIGQFFKAPPLQGFSRLVRERRFLEFLSKKTPFLTEREPSC